VTQESYERGFSRLAEQLIAQGYSIVAIPTCTSIGGYHADDRLVAARIENSLPSAEHFHVVVEDLDDVQTGQLFACCNLVFSTRLHGAIIAMNFGVPAIALDYEHKSTGVMQRLGDSSLSKSISSLLDGQALSAINRMVSDPGIRDALQVAVANERVLARAALTLAIRTATARR
jgi:colanic acid/amylovoran biosynthesis protein